MQPAAVLSILVRANGVQSTNADLRRLDATGRKTGSSLDSLGSSSRKSGHAMRDIGKGAAYALGAGGFGGGMYALFDITKKSIKEFRESQTVTRQTAAALKSTGDAANVTARAVADLATAISRKTGIDDESIQTSENMLLTFTKIRNETGKNNDIFNQATQAVTDMSVAMNGGATPSAEQLRKTAILVGKALNDPIQGATALRRVGVSLTDQQKEQIKTLEEHGKHLQAQKIILRELTTEFGGSAAAQATSAKQANVAFGNLAESAGRVLGPSIESATRSITKFLNQMQDGSGAGGAFVDMLKWMGSNFALFAQHVREDTDLILGIFVTIVDGVGQIARVLAKVDPTGAMGKVADRAQRAADKINHLRETIRPAGHEFDALNKTADNLGASLLANMGKGTSATQRFGQAVSSVDRRFDSLQRTADAALGNIAALTKPLTGKIGKVGDGIGASMGGGAPGKGSAALLGARSSLGPIAGIGSSFGLHVSSGLRPGAVTSSGNPSYHSTGEAIDEAGPPAGMMQFFKTMKSKYGSRLAELIYTPGGIGIKDGKPFRYTGQVAADHFDHVHVALDTGKPGVGDGFGKVRAAFTGDGPGKGTFKSLASRVWAKATGLMGSPGAMPPIGFAPSLAGGHHYAHFSGDSGRITISEAMLEAIRDAKNKDHDYALEALVHEFAHARQRADVIMGDKRLREGGAEIFASRMTPGIMQSLGIPYNSNYPHAYQAEQKFAYGKGADWWRHGQFSHSAAIPGGSTAKMGKAAAAAPPGNAKKIWQFLISKGFTPAQAAGIIGNFTQESGNDPTRVQKGGPGRGLAQWGGKRFTALQKFAKRRGKPWSDLGTQLDFMMSELRGPENMAMTALQGAHSVAEATSVFGSKYERFGVGGNRLGPARAAFNAFKGIGGTAAQRKKAAGAKVSPFDQAMATADVNIAQTPTTGSTKVGGVGGRRVSNALAAAGALRAKEKIVGARIKKIRAALKGKLTPATRLRLTQELAQQLDTHKQLDQQATALMHPDASATGGGDIGSGDFGGGDSGDPNQPLIDAINAAADVERQRIDLEKQRIELETTIRDEQRRFANVSQTDYAVLSKAIASVASGEIGGRIGLGFMSPGFSGGGSRY